MKKLYLCILLLGAMSSASAQFNLDCNEFCVIDIEMDTVPGYMNVTIHNGNFLHVNYPTIQIIDVNGDTVGNPDGLYFFFAHMGGDTVVHQIPTNLTSIPANFTATVLITDRIYDTTCVLYFPMFCSAPNPQPDCKHLTVTDIEFDTIPGMMNVTIYNSCTNCASGIFGPVYCEMKVVRNVAPYDTIGEANCFCLLTPDNLTQQNYTITSYVSTLPPLSEMSVTFSCGNGLCDSLNINPALSAPEIQNAGELTIYPNPARETFTIFTLGNLKAERLEIFNVVGQKVKSERLTGNKTDISDLPAGIYIISIETNRGNEVRKLVKE